MANESRHTVIVGTGRSIPSTVVPNSRFLDNQFFMDYGKPVDPATNPQVIDKFHQITDIRERRYVEEDRVTSDLATEAATAAIEDAGIDPESLDYIIVAHNFGDVDSRTRYSDMLPSLAARTKQNLRIKNPACVAYDLPFGCPGWVQGMIQAHYFLQSGDAERALVIGAESLSRVSDPHDRDSMIYSDGAGAAVIEAQQRTDAAGFLTHATRSDTLKHARLLWMGPSYMDGHEPERLFVKMYGRKLYSYAVNHVPALVKDTLDRAGVDITEVKKVFLHQANAKMDEAIVLRLFRLYGIDDPDVDAVMPMSIETLGNSSVATVPTLLDLVLKGELGEHEVHSGDVIVLASVGAGMNVNSIVYRWP